MELKRHYLTDEHNQRVAVQLDIETFERLERILKDAPRILKDYGLARLIEANDDEVLDLEGAKAYYNSLEKAPWESRESDR
ncbi:MAG: hypothetical protein M3511_09400 [Deinococcota bacterium]|jgi:hypothetical protein|nr:hypothetical protein [Deinococcota bacterium]